MYCFYQIILVLTPEYMNVVFYRDFSGPECMNVVFYIDYSGPECMNLVLLYRLLWS